MLSLSMMAQSRFTTDSVEAFLGNVIISESLNEAGNVIAIDTVIEFVSIGKKASKHNFYINKHGNVLMDEWDEGTLRYTLLYVEAKDQVVRFVSTGTDSRLFNIYIDFVNFRVAYLYDDDLKKILYY